MPGARNLVVPLLAAVLAASLAWLYLSTRRIDPDVPGFVFDGAPAQDRYERLVRFPGKRVVPCPAPGPRQAVILAIGQSNIANYAETRVVSQFPDRVFNFFNGACFSAASPLLGADNGGGEWLTLLGDALVRSGRFDSVVIAPAAVGGSTIQKFSDGLLRDMLDDVVRRLTQSRAATHVIWHQGEADFIRSTPAADYRERFLQVISHLRASGVVAPVYVSIATSCLASRRDWSAGNPIASVLRALPDRNAGIFAGVDSDAFGPAARYDNCHMSTRGQHDLADQYARIFTNAPTRD